mmetsp:Transcript_27623/g.47861  ORF Transcript_27623/g.47861 Transcript_27623/m.47861 type:complete len:276 (+) Transcript_27623:1981-2808(+)
MNLKTFQSFLDWFHAKFPCFHDNCFSRGDSCKNDPAPQTANVNENIDTEHEIIDSNVETLHDGEHNADDDDLTFLCYVHPTPAERLGDASRTEVYRCRSCSSFTRFPRYNKALWVTSTQQGRCGDYYMLLYQMLRVLGNDHVRWVVDWADHVWAEVWLGSGVHGSSEKGRWVHLDPCEAAVDNPLLYESWGKNQTYIVAFHDPFYLSSRNQAEDSVTSLTSGVVGIIPAMSGATLPSVHSSLGISEHEKEIHEPHRFPPVEDITRESSSDKAYVN